MSLMIRKIAIFFRCDPNGLHTIVVYLLSLILYKSISFLCTFSTWQNLISWIGVLVTIAYRYNEPLDILKVHTVTFHNSVDIQTLEQSLHLTVNYCVIQIDN